MHDGLGNPVTTDSAAAAELVELAIDRHVRAWPGADNAAGEALQHDPAVGIAHALLALAHAGRLQRDEARTAMERARAGVAEASERERSLVDLVGLVVQGRPHDALPVLLQHTARHPTDLLAISTGMGAYGVFAFSGRADHETARLVFLDGLVPHFPADFPWLLAYRGWTRIELGAVDEGLAMAQRALQLRRENAHNAHIVAHGMHEGGRPQDILPFVADWLCGYDEGALMWGHLQWHAALAELALDQPGQAMARLLGPLLRHLPRGLPFMGLADTVALAWRLGLHGVAGVPWGALADHAARYYPQGSNPFGELHLAMLAAARRDLGALEAVQTRMERRAQQGHAGAAAARDWARALRALVQGDPQAAASHFAACEEQLVCAGGSKAQRSVVRATHEGLVLPQED